jgi:hypothetical protein
MPAGSPNRGIAADDGEWPRCIAPWWYLTVLIRRNDVDHSPQPGQMLVASSTPAAVRARLEKMGYRLQFAARTSGPITAIWFDRQHGTFWGAASNHGEDTGIAW